MSKDRILRLQFAGIIVLFVVLAVVAWRNGEVFYADEGRLKIRQAQEGGDVVLLWLHPVDVPMARRFEEAFDEYRDKTDKFVIELHSPGGAISEGADVIDVIEKMKRTHRVETHIRAGRLCASMCVPIYLQGDDRVAAPSARFMFHEPSMRDPFTEEERKLPAFEQNYITQKFFERYLNSPDINPQWRDKLERDMRGREIWKSGRDLVAEEAGIVTALE